MNRIEVEKFKFSVFRIKMTGVLVVLNGSPSSLSLTKRYFKNCLLKRFVEYSPMNSALKGQSYDNYFSKTLGAQAITFLCKEKIGIHEKQLNC